MNHLIIAVLSCFIHCMCLCAEQEIANTSTQELEIIKELMTEITDLKTTVQTLGRIDTEKRKWAVTGVLFT